MKPIETNLGNLSLYNHWAALNTASSNKIGPGEYSHLSLHKQMSQSRYKGKDLREIRKTHK